MNITDSNLDRLEVVVIDTGTANLASILRSLKRCGLRPVVSRRVSAIERADALVLPGVGSFGAGMETLRSSGLVDPIRRRILEGAPTLGICLGLQILARESEESPGVEGLGVVDARVRRLPPGRIRPHLGWNRVAADGRGSVIESDGAAYFANGFALLEAPADWGVAWTRDGGRFVAAIERENVVAPVPPRDFRSVRRATDGSVGLHRPRRWRHVDGQNHSVSRRPGRSGGEGCALRGTA